jgi:uncharacterized membrane protein
MLEKSKQIDIMGTRLSINIAIALCYLWFWISGAVLLIAERRNRIVCFHAWQSILTFGSLTAILLLFLLIPPVPYGIIYFSLMALWIVVITLGAYLWILLVATAFIGRPYTLPFIGRIANRLTDSYPGYIAIGMKQQVNIALTGNPADSKVCVVCGKSIPQTAIFCPECGERQLHEVMAQIDRLGQTLESQKDINDKRRINTAIRKALDATVNTVTVIGETRDPYTAGHQRRVSELACAIAGHMNISYEQIEGLNIAGQLHDIGKISVPSDILNKPGKLSEGEMLVIKGHAQISYDIMKDIEFPWPVAQIIYQHHERLDGSGYPMGLKGDYILVEARILAVADVVEAMASHRPYRPAMGIDLALKQIVDNKGLLYDPDVVDSCITLFTEKGFKFK